MASLAKCSSLKASVRVREYATAKLTRDSLKGSFSFGHDSKAARVGSVNQNVTRSSMTRSSVIVKAESSSAAQKRAKVLGAVLAVLAAQQH